jgi:hypothetical protein
MKLITTPLNHNPLLSSSAKADDPVITAPPADTGSAAFADDANQEIDLPERDPR